MAFSLQPPALAQQSICAQVKIEILQELTLEREAFEARMTINNGVAGVPLDNLSVDVTFADKSGVPVRATLDPNDLTAKFYIRLQTGSSIPASIPGETSAKILWLIIPARGAGGANPQGELYSVGATLRYRAAGANQEMQVSPDTIYVKPMPALSLDYFLPYEVYGDDPFTENYVEPVVPFSLGVRVKNDGYGPARKLKIESAQPRIIENKLGLLVDFRIEASEVNGQPATPSLLCDFGDIPPNRSGVARWTMISTLSGRFVEFTANYTHADELGGQLTSLITAQPRTHLLVRDVLIDLPGRDTVRDFLAKDGDVLRVYESENADTVVNDVSAGSSISGSGGHYTLGTTPASGFFFIKRTDPESGRQGLRSALRADGKGLNPANAWLSKTWDRTALHWDYFVNLFDVNNTSGHSYTLKYEPLPGQSNRPPKLDSINNWTINPGNRLGFPITAFDPDGDRLTYTFLSHPVNAPNATLDEATGFFQWQPKFLRVGTNVISPVGTNVFVVRVTDNGVPPLTDTTNFFVAVVPVQGFELSLGTTNIFTGESNSLPLVLKSDLPLTNVSWVLASPPAGGLTSFELKSVAPEVYGYTITDLGSGRYALSLDVDAQRVQNQTRQLALLGFQSIPVAHSTIVRLPANGLLGRDTLGKAITNGTSVGGNVIVFANESVLVANPDKSLTLYGRPGGSYAVESRKTISTSDPWAFLQRFPLTNRYRTFPVLAPPPSSFYQAYEFQAEPPLLEVGTPGPGGSLPVLVYGQPGVNYIFERSLSVGGEVAWTEVLTFTMVNSWQFIDAPAGTGSMFFRVRQNPPVPVRLDILGVSGPLVTLRLQGKPGTNYVIEARTQLGTNVAWIPVLGLTLTNATQTFTWTNSDPATRFFRAIEGSAITQPFLVMEDAHSQAVTLRLNGMAGGLYVIESATNVGVPMSWVPVQQVILTNTTQRFSITNHGEPVRVFRARVN